MKVYISATQRDLLECRAAVHAAMRRLGIEDVAMEAYVAESRPPLEKCLEDVRRCELYIGVFAWRYGFKPYGSEISITELEYREAVRLNKPCFVFLLAEDASWPGNLIDRGADGERIVALRRELSDKHVCNFFTGPDDLAAKVTAALANFRFGEQQSRPPTEAADPLSEAARRGYTERLRQRYQRIALDALTPTPTMDDLSIGLTSVFVEPYARADARPEIPRAWLQPAGGEGEPGTAEMPGRVDQAAIASLHESYQAKPPSPLFDIIADPDHRTIVLLGDPGAGKSAVTRYLALALSDGRAEPRLAALRHHLPILIELRSYLAHLGDGRCEDFLDYLDHQARGGARLGLRREALESFLRTDGKALFLFDGLDEILEPQRRAEVADQIAAFAAEYSAVRILVTSRVVGYARRTLTDAGFDHFTLDDLDNAQIDQFLHGWYSLEMPDRPGEAQTQRERIGAAIRSSPAIRELAGNPLLLTILAIIGNRERLPEARRKLYDHAADVLISHWELREHHGDSEPLDTDSKKALLQRLAFQMQSQEGGLSGNYIESSQLVRVFEDYLVERYQYGRGKANMMAHSMIDQFRERNFILGRYGQRLYGFVHRTFLEFFCAQAIVDRFHRDDPDWSITRLRALFTEHWADPSWREVLRLVVGYLAPDEAGSLITMLATEVNRPWPPEEFAQAPWNLALAAQCVAEVHDPGAIAPAAETVLRQLILLVEHGISIEDRNTAQMTEAEILPAVRVLGAGWPGQQSYLYWYRRRGVRVSWTAGSSFGTRMAVLLATPEECIEDFLDKTLGATDDRRALHALVAGLAESAALAYAADNPASHRRRSRCQALLMARAREDNHGAVRLAAQRALVAQFGTEPQTTRLLLEQASNDTYSAVRLAAVETLSMPEEWAQPVRLLLFDRARNDPDNPVRRASVEALGRRGGARDDVVDLLLDRVRRDRDPGVLQGACRALIHRFGARARVRDLLVERIDGGPHDGIHRAVVGLLGESFPYEEVGNLLVERVGNDPDPGSRHVALRALIRFGDAVAGLPDRLVERVISDDDAGIRLTALRTLVHRYRSDPGLRAVLAQQVCRDADATVRTAAVQALAECFGDDVTADILIDRAHADPAAGVRLAATQVLAKRFGSDSRTRALTVEQAVREQDTIVRLAATRSLVAIGADPDIRDRLLDRVENDPDPQITREAATAHAAWPTYRERLVRLLTERARTNSYAGMRLAAVDTLVSLFGAGSVAALLVEIAGRDRDPAVFEAVVRTLVERPGDRPIPKQLLVERAAEDDAAIRLAAVTVLGDHLGDDPQIRALLIDRTRNDEDVQVRRAALGRLGDTLAHQPGVRTLLVELIDDPDWSVRRAAVRALGRHFGTDEDIRSLFIERARDSPDTDFRQLVGQALTWMDGADPDHLPDA
jgi:HEAT repeat protein